MQPMDKILHELYHISKQIHQLHHLGEKLMSKVQEFVDAQNAFNDRMDLAVSDLQADIQNLNDQIKVLQDSLGELSPEDKLLLDGLQERAKGIADKLDALNALTPPVSPPVE